ncbi:MAG: TldD/PmbA family protein [Candidatus Heimdallarchaeota archaeon]|nr:TldD/PmbA family protein [Candidatus Heimdallarchaeota archaeon]
MSEKVIFDSLSDDLMAIVDRGLKYAKDHYADFEHELYVVNSKSLNISINAGMTNAIKGGAVGIGVRSVSDQKVGFSSSSGIEDENVNFAIDNAVALSKSLDQVDDRWKTFVDNKNIGKDGKLYDDVLEFTAEEAVKGANSIFEEAKAVDAQKIISVSGNVNVQYGGFAVGNTLGINKATRFTVGVATSSTTAKAGDKTKDAFDYVFGRNVPDFSGIGTKGAKEAIKLLDSKPYGKTGQTTVVYDNLSAAQMINTGLANSINGKSVLEGRSAWADKMGDKVGLELVNIYDDPTIPEDPNMQAIDAEGYPKKKTGIIEGGILKSFIFDQYNALAHGSENTGNANRGGQQSYEAMPSISTSTLNMMPGSKDLDSIVSEAGDGIYVTGFLMGIGHSNLISGDFSIVSPTAYLIENGEIKNPIDSVTIAGNLYKSFNQVVDLTNDAELTFMGKIPKIAYEGFTVSG